jgi:hypothetical protein
VLEKDGLFYLFRNQVYGSNHLNLEPGLGRHPRGPAEVGQPLSGRWLEAIRASAMKCTG